MNPALTQDEEDQTNKWLVSQNQDPWAGGSPLSPNVPQGTIQAPQPKTPANPTLAQTDSGAADEDNGTADNDERIQDSHPGHQSDDLLGAETAQKMQQAGQYGPEQEKAVLDSIMKSQGSIGNRFARGAAGLGDAIMGVAGKTSPGFLNNLENRQQNQSKMAIEANPMLQKMNAEKMAAQQTLEGQTNQTPLGKAKADFLQPLLMKFFPGKSQAEYAKMLQNPDDVARMIGIPADVYKGEVEAKMKAQELGIQGKRADIQNEQVKAQIQNEQEQRKQEQEKERLTAAQETLKGSSVPFFGPTHAEKQAAARTMSGIAQGGTQPISGVKKMFGGDSNSSIQSFGSEEEAEKANLPDGTPIVINGVKGKWRHQ